MTRLNFLEKVLDKSIEYLHELTFDKNIKQHLYLILLYCRIVELIHSCNILMKERIIAGVPILLRTVLETFADLKNLSNDQNYVNSMDASNLHEWLRIFKEAVSGDNEYLESISKMENLKQTCAEYKTELKILDEKGFVPLKHFDRFEKAGMSDEYRSVYNSVCCDSHSNTRSLYKSYTNITGDDFTVIYCKDPEPFDIGGNSTILCDILVDASFIVHDYFNSGLSLKVKSINTEWEELKSKHLTKISN